MISKFFDYEKELIDALRKKGYSEARIKSIINNAYFTKIINGEEELTSTINSKFVYKKPIPGLNDMLLSIYDFASEKEKYVGKGHDYKYMSDKNIYNNASDFITYVNEDLLVSFDNFLGSVYFSENEETDYDSEYDLVTIEKTNDIKELLDIIKEFFYSLICEDRSNINLLEQTFVSAIEYLFIDFMNNKEARKLARKENNIVIEDYLIINIVNNLIANNNLYSLKETYNELVNMKVLDKEKILRILSDTLEDINNGDNENYKAAYMNCLANILGFALYKKAKEYDNVYFILGLKDEISNMNIKDFLIYLELVSLENGHLVKDEEEIKTLRKEYNTALKSFNR